MFRRMPMPFPFCWVSGSIENKRLNSMCPKKNECVCVCVFMYLPSPLREVAPSKCSSACLTTVVPDVQASCQLGPLDAAARITCEEHIRLTADTAGSNVLRREMMPRWQGERAGRAKLQASPLSYPKRMKDYTILVPTQLHLNGHRT